MVPPMSSTSTALKRFLLVPALPLLSMATQIKWWMTVALFVVLAGCGGGGGMLYAGYAGILAIDPSDGSITSLSSQNASALAYASPVPLPAAAWLFISAIAGLAGAKRLSRSKGSA